MMVLVHLLLGAARGQQRATPENLITLYMTHCCELLDPKSLQLHFTLFGNNKPDRETSLISELIYYSQLLLFISLFD